MSFYTLLTAQGAAILTNAYVAGTSVSFTHLALGDGNGLPVIPTEGMTTLVHEVHRVPLSAINVDANNPNWLVAEAVLPTTIGGWTIREVGLLDTAGHLIAVGNFPDTYKPLLAEGSGRDLLIRLIVETSNAAQVTLTVDPSVVLATNQAIVNAVAAHEAKADPHPQYKVPAATTAQSGTVRLATNAEATAGTSSTIAVTPTGLAAALSPKAPLASPALTGTPTAPTAAPGDNSTKISTTEFVQAAIAALVNSSPAALDTLQELASALGSDPNFSTTMVNALAAKAPLASPALTGTPTAPTPAVGDSSTKLSTTAFVQVALAALDQRLYFFGQ